MLIDNINYLRKYYRPIRDYLKDNEEDILTQPIYVVKSKTGQLSLEITVETGTVSIHSKYDPEKEAQRLISKYEEDMNQYKQVFFYGIGLGYHVKAFMEKYPNLTYTLYEPNPAIFYHFLANKKIEDLNEKQIKDIYLETSENEKNLMLNQFVNQLDDNVLFVSLPSYEKIFQKEYQLFLTQFKKKMKDKNTTFFTNLAFEKRWTINSMKNFPAVLNTPNILQAGNSDIIKGLPVILVAAGPSLNNEIENLRYIKENKLAYIFAVGSANKALINNDILPDAVCTYDPQGHNYKVFEEIIKKGLEIPLIFGSSVGYETIKKYSGPKAHMITSQDTVSQYYLGEEATDAVINDASSIAIITLQLLVKLQVSSIILVGQNLAYKDSEFYSKGIDYSNMGKDYSITQDVKNKAITIKDVNGNDILTSKGFFDMKQELEQYISLTNIKVINTTVGGACIKGTTFIRLHDLILNHLCLPVVDDNWFEKLNINYDVAKVKEKQETMNSNFKEFGVILGNLEKILQQINLLVSKQQVSNLERQFNRLDKEFKRFRDNQYYKVFINPMVRISLELTIQKIQSIRFMEDQLIKGETTVKIFDKFLSECKLDSHNISPVYSTLEQSYKKTRGGNIYELKK
ncbi:motility associated factor glycosyltransferase family protein [Sediminibacillus albus]|uniref:Uncharacterized conserved protein n=1 Tax=Sediminibacillus albus TaxID=407036 RepID=A0A1G8YME7_9BACI|nr:6-hydroxymethylpterin diphosphokinase MptE-like protein [Sediminibacillus albus]SDK04009.1 Uncharacterized conserved protein [Sediminibacillus albus]